MAIISAKNFSFCYSLEVCEALKDVNFNINQGELILIAGDSGSGKSTLMKALNGLIPEIVDGKLGGERKLNGKDMLDIPIYDISKVIGSVFQNPRSQFFTLKTTDELVFAMENYGFSRQKMEDRLSKIKEEIDIENLFDRQIFTLSSGQRQLLAIASSMVLNPEILIFDEPSANLDYKNAMNLKKIILDLKALNKTIIVADHRFFYLNNIIDRVFLLENNRLKIFESEKEFKDSNYDTRSFNLFSISTGFKKIIKKDNPIASIEKVYWKDILKNISLKLYTKEVTTIVGPNGAGKTSLAKVLTKSIKVDSGNIDIAKLPFYLMQDADFQLFGTSVEAELDIGNNKIEEDEKLKILNKLNILKYKNTHPFDLSGGEKQRLQIAMASVSEAELIIFDEPTSGLDVKSMKRVVEQIDELSERKSILIISHDYEFIRKVSNRIVYLKDGQIYDDFILDEINVSKLNSIFKEMEVNNE